MRRLSAVIALVALGSLSLLAFLTIYVTDRDVSNLSLQDETSLGHALANALAVSYGSTGSWRSAHLSGVLSLATGRGVVVKVLDSEDQVVTSAQPADVPTALGATYSFPIEEGSVRVGTVQVQIARGGRGIVGSLRHDLGRAVEWSALGAAVLAIGAGVLLARRMTVPLRRLTDAARSVASGERGIRVHVAGGTDEVAELSRAFNAMAGSLDRQEKLRRSLVADVAHELRTPVAVLQAWLEAMVEGVVEADTPGLSSLLDETLRLSRIVKDLHVLASSDVDALSLEFHLVDLAELASDAALSMEAKLTAAELTLTKCLEPALVNGDRTRLHQVISNLLTNAIKFTAAGGQITLSVATQGQKARLTVQDTGMGIPADELPHVFERFWRGQRAAGRSGSGIGLAVVAELTQAHGGRVDVTSRAGNGTRFVVTLPARTG